MKKDPLQTIKQFVKNRHNQASAVFWAGSVIHNKASEGSDLDLIIVYEHLPNAYRETCVLNDWPIDTFVHSPETLRYFFEESKNGSGISGLAHMISEGRVLDPSPFSRTIQDMSLHYLKEGPLAWDKNKIDMERFLLTDLLDDIEHSKLASERIATLVYFYEKLATFYFRTQRKWTASGKAIVRYLEKDNPALAKTFTLAFEKAFSHQSLTDLKQLTQTILKPDGGLIWSDFLSHAPKSFKQAPYPKGNIDIVPATIKDYPTIQNMARFYLYDLTRYCEYDSKDWAIPEDGLYVCKDFKSYFEEAKNKAYLIKINQELAGFVLLDRQGTAPSTDWNMGQFFILARFQRKKLATEVALTIFKTHPGSWEVRVIPENQPALHFWRKAIGLFTHGKFEETVRQIEYDGESEYRYIFTFQTGIGP